MKTILRLILALAPALAFATDPNPALPQTRVNRLISLAPSGKIELDSPLVFKNPADAAATATVLGIAGGVTGVHSINTHTGALVWTTLADYGITDGGLDKDATFSANRTWSLNGHTLIAGLLTMTPAAGMNPAQVSTGGADFTTDAGNLDLSGGHMTDVGNGGIAFSGTGASNTATNLNAYVLTLAGPQTVTGVKKFNYHTLVLKGAISGEMTLDVPDVLGTNGLLFPAETGTLAVRETPNVFTAIGNTFNDGLHVITSDADSTLFNVTGDSNAIFANSGVLNMGGQSIMQIYPAGNLILRPTGELDITTATAVDVDAAVPVTIHGDLTVSGAVNIPAGSIAYSKLNITGAILNTDLAGSIADSKLLTITTSGKVANSATTATSANTAAAIVARDGSGNFTAGTITANLTGTASSATNAATATALQTSRTINGVAFDGTANISTTGPPSGTFGSGADGDVTVSTTITLTRAMYYHNLTMTTGGQITTAGYPIFVSGTLDITGAVAGAFQWNGTAGPSASGVSAGAAGTANTAAALGGSTTGTTGKAGSTGAGNAASIGSAANSNGGRAGNGGAGGGGQSSTATGTITDGGGVNVTAGDTVTINGKVYTFVSPIGSTEGNVLRDAVASNSMANLVSAITHVGGVAGVNYVTAATNPNVTASGTSTITLTALTPGTPGNAITLARSSAVLSVSGATLTGGADTAGGAAATASAPTNVYPIQRLDFNHMRGVTLITGGGGGSSGGGGAGDGTAGGGSGTGGTGGGVFVMAANTINRSGATAAGCFQFKGGNGGAGGTPVAGNRGGGGGAGGGGGGEIWLTVGTLTGTTATNCFDVSGGNGGNGGDGTGFGNGGNAGDGGYGGRITCFKVYLDSWTTSDFTSTAGTAGGTATGTTHGNGGAGTTAQGSL